MTDTLYSHLSTISMLYMVILAPSLPPSALNTRREGEEGGGTVNREHMTSILYYTGRRVYTLYR